MTFPIFRFLINLCWLADTCYSAPGHLASKPRFIRRVDHEVDRSPSCRLGPGAEWHRVVNGSGSYWSYQTYKSAPFNPPELQITSNGEPLAPGLLFMTPGNFGPTLATKDVAPMIMTDGGQLVWEGSVTDVTVTNLQVSLFERQPVLTYWVGPVTTLPNFGHGYGNITFRDTSYNEILVVCPKLGLLTADNTSYPCEADVHESLITSRGTLLFTAHNVTRADLSSIGGPKNGWVYDSLVYDVQPRTGEILFRWSSLEHVPVSSTKMPLSTGGRNQSVPLNYFMVNSAADVGDTYLINGRHTSAVYLVNKQGDILWSLDGETGGDFGPLPPNGQFSWQHDVRAHNVTNCSMVITMLNSYGIPYVERTKPSNALSLRLTLPPSQSHPVTVPLVITDPPSFPPTVSNSQGSNMVLPNGNQLVDYGQIPVAREYGPAGGSNNTGNPHDTDMRWQARFGRDNLVQNYRMFKQEWKATPVGTKPSLFVDAADQDGCRFAYASWNGATSIKAWKVYEGNQKRKLRYLGEVPFRGFETRFVVGAAVVQVGAVMEDGAEYRSEVVSGSYLSRPGFG